MDEVACAFNIPQNSAVEEVKAVCGLGNAPRSWWLSVDRFMLEHGSARSRADPAIWIFSFGDEDNTTYALVAAYVDDFIITGVECKEFTNLKNALRDNFRWGT